MGRDTGVLLTRAEKVIQTNILKRLRKLPRSKWVKIIKASDVGTPDIIGCFCGLFVTIEVKSEKGETTLKQSWELQGYSEAEGLAIVARRWEDVVFGLKKLIKERNIHYEMELLKIQ